MRVIATNSNMYCEQVINKYDIWIQTEKEIIILQQKKNILEQKRKNQHFKEKAGEKSPNQLLNYSNSNTLPHKLFQP